MKIFLIDEGQLNALRRTATRLHTEERLDGNAMRDMGHTLESIVRACTELEVPDEGAPAKRCVKCRRRLTDPQLADQDERCNACGDPPYEGGSDTADDDDDGPLPEPGVSDVSGFMAAVAHDAAAEVEKRRRVADEASAILARFGKTEP